MAMWIMHLRLADKLLQYGFHIKPQPFYAGSIAPDMLQDNDPGKLKSHFRDTINERIQPEDFYDAFLRDQHHDPQTTAFLLGYYAHLLADVEWIGNMWRPFKREFPDVAHRLEIDSDFAFAFKRLQFFGHDMVYLHQNPGYPALETLRTLETLATGMTQVPSESYLNWLKTDVFSLYDDGELMTNAVQHDFPYLSKSDVDGWIDCTTGVLIEIFKGKRIPCPNPTPLWGDYIQPYA